MIRLAMQLSFYAESSICLELEWWLHMFITQQLLHGVHKAFCNDAENESDL